MDTNMILRKWGFRCLSFFVISPNVLVVWESKGDKRRNTFFLCQYKRHMSVNEIHTVLNCVLLKEWLSGCNAILVIGILNSSCKAKNTGCLILTVHY